MGSLKIASFDLETDGLLDQATRVWCAVVQEHGGPSRSFTPDDIDELCPYLDQFQVLIGHNSIYFDFPVLRKLYGWEYKGVKVDTLMMSRAQRPNRTCPPHCPNKSAPHSVEAWGYRLGHKKVEHNDWANYSPEMLHRCEEDTAIQVKIYHALLEEGKGEGWAAAHKLNHKLFHYLQRQEEYGWLVDLQLLDKNIATLDRWIERIDRAVTPFLPLISECEETKKDGELGFVRKPFRKDGTLSMQAERWLEETGSKAEIVGPFSRISFRVVDINSNAEVKDFLLSKGWEPTEWNTNDQGKRTSPKFSKQDEFVGIQGSLGKLIARRIQCRQRRSVLEGWRSTVRPDGRLPAAINGIATTGRIKHKNLVNVPSPSSGAFFAKWMRMLFIAKPGWVLVGTDSKGNQIRQLAARMGDDDFTQAALFGDSKDGTDIHSVNQRKSGVATRTLAKNVYYGFTFGAGDAKVGKLIGGGAAEGKRLKEEFLAGLPKFKAMLEKMTEEWRSTAKKWYNKRYGRWEYSDGYIRGLDGRPILVEKEHTVLVYFLQGDEAVHMAAAYCMAHKYIERAGYKWKDDYGFVVFMHDEFVIECRPEIAEHISQLSKKAIEDAGAYFKIPVKHEGDSKIGKSWLEVH